MDENFAFVDTTGLSDDEIELKMTDLCPRDEEKGYVPAYIFDICKRATDQKAGEISLRIGFNENIYYGGNIGYMVYPDFRGKRYALRACRLLTALARRHNMATLTITCNPDNIPSRRTCELLGAQLKKIVDLPAHNEMYSEGERQKCIYQIPL